MNWNNEPTFNWALACRFCNIFKGSSLRFKDPQTDEVVPLYHPRQDRWEEHFQLDIAQGSILGKTTLGRATVACLRMNSKSQVLARRQWIHLGLFP